MAVCSVQIFRGPEKMGQLLVQVAGRAGRESKPGKVIIQTHNPDSPLMLSLATNSYQQFAMERLAERQQQGFPPMETWHCYGQKLTISNRLNNSCVSYATASRL